MHLRDLATDPRLYPLIVTVHVDQMERDEKVTWLPLREARIAELCNNFDPAEVGLPLVSARSAGGLVVLNGSHRIEALRRLGYRDVQLEVRMFVGLDPEDERVIFERHHEKWIKKAGKKRNGKAVGRGLGVPR